MKNDYLGYKVEQELLSPEEYLNLSAERKANIAHAKIIPPLLDQPGFGKIQVDYKIPFFRIKDDKFRF